MTARCLNQFHSILARHYLKYNRCRDSLIVNNQTLYIFRCKYTCNSPLRCTELYSIHIYENFTLNGLDVFSLEAKFDTFNSWTLSQLNGSAEGANIVQYAHFTEHCCSYQQTLPESEHCFWYPKKMLSLIPDGFFFSPFSTLNIEVIMETFHREENQSKRELSFP